MLGAGPPRTGRPPTNRLGPFGGWPTQDGFFTHVQSADVEVWDGSEYQPDADQVYGEQRLRMRIGVARDVTAVTITYAHFTELGQVPIPRIDVPPEGRQ
jgi:hypothetical protein